VRADRPSSTAALIAMATLFVARDRAYAQLVPDGAAELCERCLSGAQRRLARLPALARAMERATIPGLCLHFMMRKRWIEQRVRSAVARGAHHVVVIGAGFDTLALRLARELPAVQFTEVDHPATQAVKRAALSTPANVRLIAADLARTPLESAVPKEIASAPSVFIAEGVLMYLSDAQVAVLCAAIRALQRSGGELIFTVMEPAADGRIRFHNSTWLERALLALWKEPFRSALARAQLDEFLGRHGYALREYADLAAAHPELPLARGELVVHARNA
jgi:methyltransferase (TIGR00027 family)